MFRIEIKVYNLAYRIEYYDKDRLSHYEDYSSEMYGSFPMMSAIKAWLANNFN